MSAAKIQFSKLDFSPAGPGEEQTFSFNCPRFDRRCGDLVIAGKTDLKRDPQGQNGGIAQWDWNGDRDLPSFIPSVNCQRCWHGHIQHGRCQTTAYVDEPEIKRERT